MRKIRDVATRSMLENRGGQKAPVGAKMIPIDVVVVAGDGCRPSVGRSGSPSVAVALKHPEYYKH